MARSSGFHRDDRSAASPAVRPGTGGLRRQLVQVQGAETAVDDQLAVADAEVVELETADRAGAGDLLRLGDQQVADLAAEHDAEWLRDPHRSTLGNNQKLWVADRSVV
ncbi:hypothetical protein [Streptomyces coelicoflavus]|uniref:hypothetical protein n=1 Tax=Streptomyces coelicoflavus TaxID=285562 RepID=UPI001944D76D|nr:hypothetical protein [Streptomyces coelicoflavus]